MFRSETEYGTKAGIPQSCCSKSQACDLRSTSDDPDNIFKVCMNVRSFLYEGIVGCDFR